MQLFYKQYSCAGEPLIILHGLFGNQGNWAMHAKKLSEQFSIYGFDARNHGRSGWAETMSYQEMAEDLIETMDALGLSSAHFIAHSMGGKTAMQLAMLAPDRIKKMILVDIAPVEYPAGPYAVLEGLESLDLSTLTSRSQADLLLQKYVEEKGVRDFLLTNLQKDKQGAYSWRLNLSALVNCYSEIKAGLSPEGVYPQEVLFIKGADSDYILAEHREAILRQFPATKIKIIENAGHWVHSEKPSAFIKIVEGYLS